MINQRFIPCATLLLLTAYVVCDATAWGDPPIVNDAPRPHVAAPLAKTTPLITAAADDPAWNDAAAIPINTPSLSNSPPPPIPIPGTEVRVMWDPAWLYVRFLCKDDHPYLPPHNPGDPIYTGDVVEVFIDPVGDCREWVEVELNAASESYDQLTLCTGEPKWDATLHLNGDVIARDIWVFPHESLKEMRHAAAPWTINGQTVGWIVDVAIPASGLLKRTGLKKFQAMSLHGDFLRYKTVPQPTGTKRDFLSLTWSPITLGNPHRCPAAFGIIDLDATPK